VYVDVTAPPYWSRTTLHAVDLDLDVVRRADGEVLIDDEDEFAEHQVALAYPPEVVAAARASADRLVGLLRAGHPPYDGSAAPWFDVLSRWLRKAR
jgi:protein associated with RNAse G/E